MAILITNKKYTCEISDISIYCNDILIKDYHQIPKGGENVYVIFAIPSYIFSYKSSNIYEIAFDKDTVFEIDITNDSIRQNQSIITSRLKYS